MVRDSDGSAFITKAEFDSLKNNFQSQIDNYNSSIDSKIDGAIAAYLSGIKISSSTEYSVFNSNWNSITNMNYAKPNKYKSIEWDLNIVSVGRCEGSSAFGGSSTNYVWYHVKSPTTLKTEEQHRILVDAGKEVDAIPTFVVWDGISCNLHEKMQLNESWEHEKKNSGCDYYVHFATAGSEIYAVDVFNFIKYGYINNLLVDAKIFWSPNIYYYHYNTASHRGNNTRTVWLTYTCGSSIELLEVGGKIRDYEHVISFDNLTFDYPTDIDWTKTINVDDSTTNTSIAKKKSTLDTLIGDVTKGSALRIGYASYGTTAGGFQEKVVKGSYVGAYGSTANDNDNIPSIGLIKNHYDSEHIKQYDDKNIPSIVVGTTTFKPSTPDTLFNGYCLGGACNDQEFKWTPKFSSTYAYSRVDGSLVSDDFELNVQLSYVPYTVSMITTDDDIVKTKGSAAKFLTTTGKTVTFDADIKKTGLIYCKWWPVDDSIRDNCDWEATLDLSSCGTYTIVNKS